MNSNQDIIITHEPEESGLEKILNYVSVGYFLLIAYLLQHFLDIRWERLEIWQADESYKRWSGFILATFMILQWSLTWVKIVKRWSGQVELFTSIHKWMGALSPIIFYIHATHFGYAYLFFLSTLFFSNIFLAFLNTDQLKLKTEWYINGWMILHVSVSVLLTLLMFYHGFIAYYYK